MKTVVADKPCKRFWFLVELRCPHGKRCIALQDPAEDSTVIGGMDCCGSWQVNRKLCIFTEAGLLHLSEIILDSIAHGDPK